MNTSIDIVDLLVTTAFAILGYLLQQKDTKQGKQIDLLFEKHDHDAAALDALKLKIAEQHYQKAELDRKFHSLENATREGFLDLGKKLDRLSDALLAHITHEGK